MTDPKPGEIVRVVIETTVTDWPAQMAAVGGDMLSVEILPPAPRLGDVLYEPADYGRTPKGAVAKDAVSGQLLFKYGGNTWMSHDGLISWEYDMKTPRTVVFLP